MSYIGRYKTLEGASKRARFEDAHQDHLVKRYRHKAVKVADCYRVERTAVKESEFVTECDHPRWLIENYGRKA